jgi:hypothetical protein
MLDPVQPPNVQPNALVQLQAHYHRCGEAASEKCLSAATFVRQRTPKQDLISLKRILDKFDAIALEMKMDR